MTDTSVPRTPDVRRDRSARKKDASPRAVPEILNGSREAA
jgi:hypothetical protein